MHFRFVSRTTIAVLSILFLSYSIPAWAQLSSVKRPKLILVLVIDQFRADQLSRFQGRFLPALRGAGELGGFRYLMEKGAYYPFAEYGLLQNMTGPGHATILSGAYPYQHGIPINIWFDQTTGKPLYCVEDSASAIVGEGIKPDKKGMSPRNFQGSTVGDELKNSGYHSKVVSLALKDRAAVLLGGYRNDLALWFDADSNSWISSRFYAPEGKLPEWVTKMNRDIRSNQAPKLSWSLPSSPVATTSLPDNGFILDSKMSEAMGRSFPHQISGSDSQALAFPYGTQLTVNAGLAALEGMQLGQGKDTDILAMSFSNHDFVAHEFGPNSRELEELTVVEDQEIARLLTAVQKKVGMENTIVVLTADHGGVPSPEWLKSTKVDAGRVDEQEFRKLGEEFLIKTYGPLRDQSWIPLVVDFSFYLNRRAIQVAGHDLDQVRTKLAKFFQEKASTREGIAHIFTATDVRNKNLPGPQFAQQIQRTYREDRSGDVIFILKPFYITNGSTAEHLSGYAYDRMVPLILAGPQIKAGIYGQKAEIVDIAPTLSFFSGTTPPSGSEGRVLHEIFKGDSKKH